MSFDDESTSSRTERGGFPTITSNYLESAARGVQNWSYFRERPRGHVLKRARRLAMGVVTEVPRQQVARRVAQLDVCMRLRPMCLHALESGPGLAGYCISDLIEPLFRRVARPNRPIIGSATYRNTPREVLGPPSPIADAGAAKTVRYRLLYRYTSLRPFVALRVIRNV